MKKVCAVLLIAVTATLSLSAQNRQQVSNLATLAKTWGFLKYYHPAVAKGQPDWDQELIRMIPIAGGATSETGLQRIIADWYHSLPPARLSDSITQIKGDTITRVFDETDISRFGLSVALADAFTRLYLFHLPDSSKYITNRYRQYTLDYVRHVENPFPTPALPDEAHRLLALFRYWNIIEYFYPYKKINTKDWGGVLQEFIPRFMAVHDSTGYRDCFLQLTTRLKDSHSFFSEATWNRRQDGNAPFEVTYIDGGYYITGSRYDSLMKKMDLQKGDEIMGVNGQTIAARINAIRPYITGTNTLSVFRNIGWNLFKGDTGRTVPIVIKRRGKLLNRTVSLFPGSVFYRLRKDPLPLWEDLGKGIWYVRFCEIGNPDTLQKLFTDLQQASTVIWDMRAYPRYNVVSVMGKGLFKEPPLTTYTYNAQVAFPGSFVKSSTTPIHGDKALELPLYKGRMIILVNEQTQSLSESVAYEMSFRPHTIVMGSQTAGTTGNITWVDFPGGIEASFTGVGVQGINDRFTEGKGVNIDKTIRLRARHLLKYKDYVLEMAYRKARNRQGAK